MAKLRGPLFSFGASGTFAKMLNFQPRSTGHIVRMKPSKAQQATYPQAICRANFKQAAEAWRALDDETRALWYNYAEHRARPPFAAFWLEWHAQHSTPALLPYLPEVDPT